MNKLFTYYHLSCACDEEECTNCRYGIWANGVLSETISNREFITNNLQ